MGTEALEYGFLVVIKGTAPIDAGTAVRLVPVERATITDL